MVAMHPAPPTPENVKQERPERPEPPRLLADSTAGQTLPVESTGIGFQARG
jgi:hypothetical protein